MADESNVDAVFSDLEQWLDSYSFALPGIQRSLGRDSRVQGSGADRGPEPRRR